MDAEVYSFKNQRRMNLSLT